VDTLTSTPPKSALSPTPVNKKTTKAIDIFFLACSETPLFKKKLYHVFVSLSETEVLLFFSGW
jgi:hypothetical protein